MKVLINVNQKFLLDQLLYQKLNEVLITLGYTFSTKFDETLLNGEIFGHN